MNEIIKFEYPINRNRRETKFGKGKDDSEIHRGMALGLVNIRPYHQQVYGYLPQQECRLLAMPKYSIFYRLVNKWFKETYPYHFDYSTIQFNKNNQCAKHIDANNVGVSVIIGLGDYQGGRLIIYDYEGKEKKYIDIKNRFFKFNGSQYYHETEAFTGNRITLIFFDIRK